MKKICGKLSKSETMLNPHVVIPDADSNIAWEKVKSPEVANGIAHITIANIQHKTTIHASWCVAN